MPGPRDETEAVMAAMLDELRRDHSMRQAVLSVQENVSLGKRDTVAALMWNFAGMAYSAGVLRGIAEAAK